MDAVMEALPFADHGWEEIFYVCQITGRACQDAMWSFIA